MRIQESNEKPPEKQQTKCSTMTEEGHPTGMNGSIDCSSSSSNVGAQAIIKPEPEQSQRGGRLKFFKDGKFILELARMREGERMSWFSVPRKTFWPPPATPNPTPLPSQRQESSTSLSVSDDNSSVQSSPWQRDHSWKQSTPRSNVSAEMTFMYRRPPGQRTPTSALRKRRRPFDSTEIQTDKCVQSDKICTVKCDQKQVKKKCVKERQKILEIARILQEKRSQSPSLKNLLSSSRPEQMVSPRKRILRELERVTLDDLSNKRSRAKASSSTPRRTHNGSVESTPAATTVKHSSSYSITSLLARREERSASPANTSLEQSPRVMVKSHDSPDASPSPEQQKYTSQQTIENTQASPQHLETTNHYSPVYGLVMQQKSPQYYSPNHGLTLSPPPTDDRLRPASLRSGYPYVPPYMYAAPPTSYLTHPSLYGTYRNPYLLPYPVDARPTAHVWSNPSSHIQNSVVDDLGSDKPLNLSKHAG